MYCISVCSSELVAINTYRVGKNGRYTTIFKSKTCIFYKNRISEVIDEIFGTTVYCHSNISMVFLFVQNFIFTVINPLIPTCKK